MNGGCKLYKRLAAYKKWHSQKSSKGANMFGQASTFLMVVSVFATTVSIQTIKCKKCQIKVVSKQTSSIKFKFYRVLEVVIKRLISNMVSPADILAFLPAETASQLRSEGATTINDLFREAGALDRELKWYSFPILVSLVRNLGDSRCKQELKEYIQALHAYLRSRSATPTPNSPMTKNSSLIPTDQRPQEASTDANTSPAIKLFVDPEWDKTLVDPESDEQERAYIASLLGTTMNHIQFVQIIETV